MGCLHVFDVFQEKEITMVSFTDKIFPKKLFHFQTFSIPFMNKRVSVMATNFNRYSLIGSPHRGTLPKVEDLHGLFQCNTKEFDFQLLSVLQFFHIN